MISDNTIQFSFITLSFHLPPARGGKICLTDHFKPLWARNVPKFGIAHAIALGVSIHSLILLSFPLSSYNIHIIFYACILSLLYLSLVRSVGSC